MSSSHPAPCHASPSGAIFAEQRKNGRSGTESIDMCGPARWSFVRDRFVDNVAAGFGGVLAWNVNDDQSFSPCHFCGAEYTAWSTSAVCDIKVCSPVSWSLCSLLVPSVRSLIQMCAPLVCVCVCVCAWYRGTWRAKLETSSNLRSSIPFSCPRPSGWNVHPRTQVCRSAQTPPSFSSMHGRSWCAWRLGIVLGPSRRCECPSLRCAAIPSVVH